MRSWNKTPKELGTKDKEPADKEARAKLDQRRQKLTAPLDRIFEQQLKPRLEKLPTRAQRTAAASTEKKESHPAPQKQTP